MRDFRPGVYRHYKGKEYLAIATALHTETREKMVVYKALFYRTPELEKEFGIDPLFVRPFAMFMEEVEFEGSRLPRFSFVREKP